VWLGALFSSPRARAQQRLVTEASKVEPRIGERRSTPWPWMHEDLDHARARAKRLAGIGRHPETRVATVARARVEARGEALIVALQAHVEFGTQPFVVEQHRVRDTRVAIREVAV
jgi:hypothetical protein